MAIARGTLSGPLGYRTRLTGRLAPSTGMDPTPVLGDLNDVPEAQTTQLLLGPPGSEIGTLGFDRPDKGDDVRLFNLAPLIPEERCFSRVHRGSGELLDQILVSEEMVPAQGDGRSG